MLYEVITGCGSTMPSCEAETILFRFFTLFLEPGGGSGDEVRLFPPARHSPDGSDVRPRQNRPRRAAVGDTLSPDSGTPFGGCRITSYNVCYTKLLRKRIVSASQEGMVDPQPSQVRCQVSVGRFPCFLHGTYASRRKMKETALTAFRIAKDNRADGGEVTFRCIPQERNNFV